MHARTLNVKVIWSIEIFYDIIFVKRDDVYSESIVDHTVTSFRKIEGEISRFLFFVSHNESIVKASFGVYNEITVRTHVDNITFGAPKLFVIRKAYLDNLYKLG